MCSICGYFSQQEVPTRIVTDMLKKIEHRGPDAHGLYADGEIQGSREISNLESSEKARVCLGHSELSIVRGDEDVMQPFRSCDGSLSLVLNGEIYNYQELRGLLG
ncbi:MAG: asparagine synthetase B, partial [Methanosarcinales archaeon]|nr:asparagine synthetase B [Methanosarcinales archaeon]